MKRTMLFTSRNAKEILRDPLSVLFGLGFPLVILLLLHFINRSIPQEAGMTLFALEKLTPGIAVFGLSFIALFSAMLISKDRSTSFLLRLYVSPIRGSEFIFGYALPLLPIAIGQMLVCFGAAMLLGLKFSWNIFLCIAVSLPIALVNIALGMLCGSLFSDKAVGGICGALLTNVSAWLSGTWFSLDLVGGAFKKAAYFLPFANAVDAGRAALSGSYSEIMEKLWIVLVWAAVLMAAAILVFSCRRKKQQGV